MMPLRRAVFVRFAIGLTMLCGFTSCRSEPLLDEAATSLVEAREAIAGGDVETAMQRLNASITARPNVWAYYERARLHAEQGDDADANADIEAGLQLDPEHDELLWLQTQMKKSPSSRFKGRSGQPPTASK